MTDYMAQMLNELMGSQRDAMPGEKKEINYDDPNVCTDFLVDFCTHEIFKNTKNDLGFCKYPQHDESMKTSYQNSNKKWKMGFETRFLDRIRRIHDDVQRKISKNETRLAMTQADNKVSEEVFEKKISELQQRREQITKRIEALMEEAQLEGEKGNVGAAQSAVEKADRAKVDRDDLDAEEMKIREDKDRALMLEENVTAGNRQMQVCQICGCFMLQNDAQQRVDDHLSGKLHIAFQNIQDTIKKMENEIEERKQKRKEEMLKEDKRREKEREERRKKRESERKRSRSRSRDRGDRSDRNDRREKDKHHDRSERKEHKKDHKEHKDHKDHRDHKDRDHKSDRDHNRDRDRDHKSDRHRSSRESDRDRKMTDGITFKRGDHDLKLTKDIVNNACIFPEDENIPERKQTDFFNNFVKDVTKFENQVDKATRPYYEKSTTQIVEFLKSSVKSEHPVSVFSDFGDSEILRTALVQCNFTDITRFIGDLKTKLHEKKDEFEDEDEEMEGEEENKKIEYKRIEEVVITECDSIHSIIDRVESCKADLCVLIVQQFESLPSQMLDSIISLIFSKESINKYMSIVRLVVCFSTSISFFKTSCSTETLNRLDMKQFQFTRLDQIFEKIISSDISPAVFSGHFLNYLRNRFFQCDYSVSAIIKAVQFAFLQKYIHDPFWKIKGETHEEEIEKYWKILKLFREEVLYNEVEESKLHIEIQTNEEYWEKLKEENMSYREWKMRTFGKSTAELKACISNISRVVDSIDPEFCKNAQKLMLDRKKAENEMESKQGKTPVTAASQARKSMKLHELQKMQKEKAMEQKNKNAGVEKVTNEIFELIMNMFKSILKPYPSSWRNVIGIDANYSSSLCHISLDSNDEFDVEKCLLNTKQFENEPLSMAWRSLLAQNKFKSVPLNEWAEGFVKNNKIAKKDQKQAFFGAAGQLEHMGLIRGNADRKNTNVHLLYHPVSQFTDY